MKPNTKPANQLLKHDNLWKARERSGLERKQVALLAGKSIDEISRYENGIYPPKLKTALKLEIIYQTPIRLLFQELSKQVENEIASKRKQHSFPKNDWFPPHSEQLKEGEFCFYANLLNNRIPNGLELHMIKKHVVNLLNVSSGYPVKR